MSATADETLIEIPLKIPEEKKISWEKQQQVIDELRTIRIKIYIYKQNRIRKNNKFTSPCNNSTV